jgi:pyridoxamine 5'-phosphate oxidase
MINLTNISKEIPYIRFQELYQIALNKNQKSIEAINISSYSSISGQVNSRFVNLKFVNGKDFIFFSNYESDKAIEFSLHDQIAATIYWNSSNTQIRMKAHIKKTSKEFNKKYFAKRSIEKNALAISSAQSRQIDTYNSVKLKYLNSLKNENLRECPDYWGGYSFIPFEIEFWEGNEFRLNKRNLYKKDKSSWNHFILEP